MGGLGNQLFIYASALQMSHKLKCPLFLDHKSGFAEDKKYQRVYLLDNFNISAAKALKEDCFLGLKGKIYKLLMFYTNKFNLSNNRWTFVNESQPLKLSRFGKNFITGYWQSEKYFVEISNIIKQEFKPNNQIIQSTIQEKRIIDKFSDSVAVCIRKGADRPHQNQNLETRIEFYKAALCSLASLHPNAHLFVFSDNPLWVKNHFRSNLPHTFITYKPESWKAIEDLYLMSVCKHHVIGTSTFHWWGAWLGEREDSKIFVPKNFAEQKIDYFPTRWHQV